MTRGYFDELIALLESGIGLERAHMGIFTALGEMYANHAPAKLMEHLKLFCTRVNIPRLISICDRQMLWRELTFLYEKYDEFDNALDTMMAHDAAAWEHVRFKDVAVKCSTVDIFYKAIQHYFDMHPALVTDLLKVLEGRIDHSRVVALVRRGGHLGVSKDYLVAVQKNNLPSVNEAMNEVLIEEDDHAALEASVDSYDNFDQLKLAEDLEVRPAAAGVRRVPRSVMAGAARACRVLCLCASHTLKRSGDAAARAEARADRVPAGGRKALQEEPQVAQGGQHGHGRRTLHGRDGDGGAERVARARRGAAHLFRGGGQGPAQLCCVPLHVPGPRGLPYRARDGVAQPGGAAGHPHPVHALLCGVYPRVHWQGAPRAPRTASACCLACSWKLATSHLRPRRWTR